MDQTSVRGEDGLAGFANPHFPQSGDTFFLVLLHFLFRALFFQSFRGFLLCFLLGVLTLAHVDLLELVRG